MHKNADKTGDKESCRQLGKMQHSSQTSLDKQSNQSAEKEDWNPKKKEMKVDWTPLDKFKLGRKF